MPTVPASLRASVGQRRWSPALLGAARRRSAFHAALLVPVTAFVAVVCLYPLGSALHLSLFSYDLTEVAPKRYVGLENYRELFASTLGRAAIRHTLVFTVAAVAIEFALGFGLALLLWADGRFNRVATALALIPVAFTPLVAALTFRSLYNADFGPIGYYLGELGVGGGRSLTSQPGTAMAALILVDVWQWAPLVMLILLAGLKSLPRDVFEAAAVDGAGPWRRLRHIGLPLMLPTIFLAVIVRTMDAFKVFDSVFAITGGGPNDATTVLNFYAFREGLKFFNVGFAAAISNVLLVLIAMFAALYIITLRRADVRYSR
jgi:multiple sugar transport system permease protein